MPQSWCDTLRLPRCARATISHVREQAIRGVTVVESIHDVNATAWDAVVAGNPWFLGRAWLDCIERAAPENMVFRYGILVENDEPVAVFHAQLIDISWDHLALLGTGEKRVPISKRAAMHLRNYALGAFGRRVLVCGNQFATGPYGIAIAPGSDSPALQRHVVDAIAAVRWPDGHAPDYIVVEDFEANMPLPVPLSSHGFGILPTEPGMTLALAPEWRTYDDYLHALKAKYRKAALKTHAEIADAGGTLEDVVDIEPIANTLHALYDQVEKRAVVRFGQLPVEHLPLLAKSLESEQFRCTVLRVHDEIVGFGTLIKDGDTAVAHIVGFDYAVNALHPVYLRILHSLVATAIEMRCARLSFGRTALEPKARLGATPTPMEVYVRHRNPVINTVAQALLRLLPQERAPDRRPFNQN